MAVSGWFVLLVLLGLVPTLAVHEWWVVGGWLLACLALAVLDVLLAGSPKRMLLSRRLPRAARLGERVDTALLLENRGRRTVRGVLRDAWTPSAGATAARHRIRVRAGERLIVEETLVPWRRGERRSEFVSIRSFGPLRLAARQRTLPAPGAVRVLPPFNSRKHLPSRLARLRELDGRTSVMIRGQGTEFDSLREYVRGDDLRSLDWRASARRRDAAVPGATKLVVRTWRPERDRRVVIVVDSGRGAAARIADEPRLDTAFEASLLLAALASRAGDRVDLVVVDRRVRARVHGATGAELMAKLVDAMAPVEAELLEPDWSLVPRLVREATTQRALVVLLTSTDSPGAASGLLGTLPALTRKHLVVVASVQDPEVVALTRARGRRSELYQAAAAERALLDAARVAAAVRRLGGQVVSAPPQELPPALADRYLELKAAGRL